MTSRPKLILASTSPYRKKLLERLQVPFEAMAPHVDESLFKNLGADPVSLALCLAQKKAQAIATKFPEAIVIGSDQVATVGEEILDKPGNKEQAIIQLTKLSGRMHRLITAVSVSHRGASRDWTEVTEITLRQLSSSEIEDYVTAENAWDCVGSYKIEGLGISLFTGVKGNDPTGIEGLPLISLSAVLRELGVR